MLSSQYELLKHKASEEPFEYSGFRPTEASSLARARKIVYTLFALLLIAVASNILLFLQLHNTQSQVDAQSYGAYL